MFAHKEAAVEKPSPCYTLHQLSQCRHLEQGALCAVALGTRAGFFALSLADNNDDLCWSLLLRYTDFWQTWGLQDRGIDRATFQPPNSDFIILIRVLSFELHILAKEK